MRVAALVAIATCAQVGRARGDEAPPPDHTVVSLPIFALSGGAFAVQVERPLARPVSLAITVAIRDGADADYQSTTLGLALEVRVWRRPRQHGWFVAPRVELAGTRVSMADRALGSALVVTEAMLIGYRLAVAGRVELTPSAGFALRHDLAFGGVPDASRVVPEVGLSLGWIFR